MTTYDDLPVAAATDTDAKEALPAADPGAPLSVGGAGVICQADSVEIGLGEDGTDPFDATFLLGGTDPEGSEVAVWIRLTPTTITNLTERLGEVLFAQQDILGISGRSPTGDVVPDRDATHDDDEEDDPEVEGRVRRFFDPMGIRHLKDRSPRTTVFLGAGIASLVILSFILQLLRG